jgi:hypothetical protein
MGAQLYLLDDGIGESSASLAGISVSPHASQRRGGVCNRTLPLRVGALPNGSLAFVMGSSDLLIPWSTRWFG